MSKTDATLPEETSSADVQLLRRGFRAESLSSEAIARIRTTTEQAWRTQSGSARLPWHKPRMLATAAAVVISLVAIWYSAATIRLGDAAMSLGRLTKITESGVVEQRSLASNRMLPVGTMLSAGQSIRARGGALVSLTGGGGLRLASGTSLEVVSEQRIRLTQGVVYLDFPPDLAKAAEFAVETPLGDFAHVGTQFEVTVQGDRAQVRVREGRVEWRSPNGATVAAEAGSELFNQRDGSINRRAISTTGADWAWAETLAPAFDLENRSLADFLHWVARESGRRLVLVDAATHARVAEIRSHGSVRGLTLMETLSAVMATTTLQSELTDNAIRVSALPEPVRD